MVASGWHDLPMVMLVYVGVDGAVVEGAVECRIEEIVQDKAQGQRHRRVCERQPIEAPGDGRRRCGELLVGKEEEKK